VFGSLKGLIADLCRDTISAGHNRSWDRECADLRYGVLWIAQFQLMVECGAHFIKCDVLSCWYLSLKLLANVVSAGW